MVARCLGRLGRRLARRIADKAAIGFYIGKQGLESTYGAAASIVVVLIWVYYTSQIILMGAEITHAYSKRHHHQSAEVHPASSAARGGA